MEYFGIVGLTFGLMAFIQVVNLAAEVKKLKEQVAELGGGPAQPAAEVEV